jgi:hypothetical protein
MTVSSHAYKIYMWIQKTWHSNVKIEIKKIVPCQMRCVKVNINVGEL